MSASWDISKEKRDELIHFVERFGTVVKEDCNEPEVARFIGTIDGNTITLFPKYDSHFAMYFTVAHLYGHLVQIVRPSVNQARGIELVYTQRRRFSASEVQSLYDYEYEAAAIGRRLIAECGPVPEEIDQQYSRMFLADFHYLIHTLETGEHGVECFEEFLRREPVPFHRIEPDARPLVGIESLAGTATGNVTVL